MASNYNLVTSQSTIQVLSPTVVQDVVVITIQTLPSLVIASLWVTDKEWEVGNAAAILSGYAANIEQVMASPKVESASSGPTLDTSGLQATEITFTVAYTPPGSPFPPATVDVNVPAIQLVSSAVPSFGTVGAAAHAGGSGGDSGPDPGVTAALAAIDNAYAQLVAVAGGTPATTGAATGASADAPAG